MTAREAAVAAAVRKHLFTLYPSEIACDCEWLNQGIRDDDLLDAWTAHVAAAIIAALDTPTATDGAYPCCDECGPGCSGRHDQPCRCQVAVPGPFDVKAEAKALFKAHTELAREGLS